MRIQCDHTTARLTESHFEGQVTAAFNGTDDKERPMSHRRMWEFVVRHPTDATRSELTISYACIEIIRITGLSFTGNAWNGLPNRVMFGPHARSVLDLCLPGILGTVAEILAMQDDGTTVAFAIARFMGIPGKIEKRLVLDYEVEDESRVRELLAPFNTV